MNKKVLELSVVNGNVAHDSDCVVPDDNHGHRKRLKEKFLISPKSFLEYEILEMLLFNIFPRKDTKPIAKNLMKKFGTLKAVLFASEKELKDIEGIGDSSVIFFKLLKEVFIRLSFQPLKEETIISSNVHVVEYYKNLLSFEKKEQFRAMFIGKGNKLISEEQLQHGTVDHATIYPREVIQRALEHGASAIIIVHNHPSGSPKPSEEDIAVTNELNGIMSRINLRLLDHIIIGGNSDYSFAEHNLL